MVEFADRIGVTAEVIQTWCQLHLPLDFEPQYAIAKAIQNAANLVGGGKTAASAEVVATLKRKALISWLVPRIDDARDSDDLMEYFLIDVNMGAQQMTSRMRQAISSVQFFVQRCLLGQEAGVKTTVVNTDRWAWMYKFALWQANRKVFLYPENWVGLTCFTDSSPIRNVYSRLSLICHCFVCLRSRL